jgi:hypothetical protein
MEHPEKIISTEIKILLEIKWGSTEDPQILQMTPEEAADHWADALKYLEVHMSKTII